MHATRAALAALLSVLAATASARADARSPEAATFDKPLSVSHVDLGPADTAPPQRKEVRCSYFPTFMVKEVDERDLGAAQLSILPSTPARPTACQRGNLPDERVLRTWTGYFDGVHGGHVFFSAEDGVNGGIGFAVVRPTDAGIVYTAIAKGPLRFTTDAAGTTVLHFSAVHAGTCSVAMKGAACATQIGREIGIAVPDVALCGRGYADAKRRMAQDRCAADAPKDTACVGREIAAMTDVDASPTVVSYDVEVVLAQAGAAEHRRTVPTACWPAD